ncbi:hypothetical protein [Sinomonas soli]
MLTALTDIDFGIWRVRTASGTVYLLDLQSEGSTLTRLPATEPPTSPLALTGELRKDGQAIPLLAVVSLEVGQEAQFWLDVRGDGVPTFRWTTEVVTIDEAENQ